MQEITLTRPDDWHLHLRDGEALKAVLPHTVRQFARAIVMPNLKPPVRTLADATAYREHYRSYWRLHPFIFKKTMLPYCFL